MPLKKSSMAFNWPFEFYVIDALNTKMLKLHAESWYNLLTSILTKVQIWISSEYCTEYIRYSVLTHTQFTLAMEMFALNKWL